MLISQRKKRINLSCALPQSTPYLDHKFCLIFLLIALLGTFVYQLLIAEAYHYIATILTSYQDLVHADPSFYMPPTIGRIAIYSGLFGGVLAGILFLHFGGWREVSLSTRIAFLVMQCWMIIHAIVAFYDIPPTLGELRGFKGPLVWVSIVILFAGTNKRAWSIFSRLVYVFSYVTAVIVLIRVLSSGSFSSDVQAGRFFQGYLPILLWTAPWILLNIDDARMPLSRLALLAFPFVVLCMACFLSVGRSWIIISILYMIVLLFKFRNLFQRNPITKYLMKVLTIVLVGIILFVFSKQIWSSYSVLSEGLLEDTRTSQYVQFFSQVSIADLVIGKGPRGTYYLDGVPYPSIDGTYTLMAFNGGLPLVVCYIVIMILPAFRILRVKPSWKYAAPAVILLFWALALTGLSTFTMPKVSIEHYILCIYAGRCHWYLNRRKQ